LKKKKKKKNWLLKQSQLQSAVIYSIFSRGSNSMAEAYHLFEWRGFKNLKD
jgi:hypothetical protein